MIALHIILLIMTIMVLDSCTISFQNISTHGTATDLVDENQAASPDVQTDLDIPSLPL